MKTRFYRKAALGVLLFVVASCSHDEKIPKSVLPIPPMSKVLVDLRLSEIYNENYKIQDSIKPTRIQMQQHLQKMYSGVMKYNRITEKQFLSSYHFYEDHPDLMLKLYHAMLADINGREAHLDSALLNRNQVRLKPLSR